MAVASMSIDGIERIALPEETQLLGWTPVVSLSPRHTKVTSMFFTSSLRVSINGPPLGPISCQKAVTSCWFLSLPMRGLVSGGGAAGSDSSKAIFRPESVYMADDSFDFADSLKV